MTTLSTVRKELVNLSKEIISFRNKEEQIKNIINTNSTKKIN
jgi:hypothetical protein